MPENANKPYDMKELINKVVDEGDFFEIQEAYAKNIITGFGRLEGSTVGFVANQPMVLAGVLGTAIRQPPEAARFVPVLYGDCSQHSHRDFCRCAGIPARYGAGRHGGIIKHGAKLLFAYTEADIAESMTVITAQSLWRRV